MSDSAHCPSLPSSVTASRVVSGDMKALPLLARDMAARAAMIGTGIAIYRGVRGQPIPARELVPMALVGSASISTFVLAYIWYNKRAARRGE